MKIERPGKACAITPCDIAEGPWAILQNGEFKQHTMIQSHSTKTAPDFIDMG